MIPEVRNYIALREEHHKGGGGPGHALHVPQNSQHGGLGLDFDHQPHHQKSPAGSLLPENTEEDVINAL